MFSKSIDDPLSITGAVIPGTNNSNTFDLMNPKIINAIPIIINGMDIHCGINSDKTSIKF